MYLYRHHTAVDIIDLNDDTGRWLPVEKSKDDRFMVGQMSMAQRADFNIKGSYTIEQDKRYCFYWNDDGELVFRSPDERRLPLFRRLPNGALLDLMPGLAVDLQPTLRADGSTVPGTSTFSLNDGEGKRLLEATYDSGRYMKFYMSNFTFVPDEDLRDWDFFVAVKLEYEELRLIALAQAPAGRDPVAASADDVITADTGAACPRAGLWVPVHHLGMRSELAEGDAMPDVEGRAERWVWVAA